LRELYVGIDGGGTKSRMRLADADLNLLAEAALEKPSNLQLRDGDAAYEAIMALCEIIFAKAQIDPSGPVHISACFGVAGGRLTAARDAFAVRKFPFAHLEVYDDIDIARAGAHNGKDGAVVIIGTGSAALGLFDGVRHQCGGWGFHVGDDMAGAILGRELLRKSMTAHEGLTAQSALTKAVMTMFDNCPEKLMAWSFNNPETGRPARPADYGEFVPLVFEYFEKNDPVAAELIAFELSSTDKYVNWFKARGARAIAIVGGLGQRMLPLLKDRYGDVIVAPKADPLQGAVILAHQLFQKQHRS